MSPLESLFRLEIEFHRRVRVLPPGIVDTGSLHTSYALQTGYEPLLLALGPVTVGDIDRLRDRLALAADSRDIRAAGDSLKQILAMYDNAELREQITQGINSSLPRHVPPLQSHYDREATDTRLHPG
jgi:hypothetical protein